MDDDLDIPEFLKRDKNAPAAKAGALPPVEDNATVPAEKWRIMEQQRRESRRVKARARIGKMMAVKADRDALASGKTWNTIKGRWE